MVSPDRYSSSRISSMHGTPPVNLIWEGFPVSKEIIYDLQLILGKSQVKNPNMGAPGITSLHERGLQFQEGW